MKVCWSLCLNFQSKHTQGLPGIKLGNNKIAYAKHEVILCAGTFETPKLLMLSGIGPRKELEKHEIVVKVEVEGIGSNLGDHLTVRVVHTLQKSFANGKSCFLNMLAFSRRKVGGSLEFLAT